MNSYEIKGNIISTGANSKAFKDNFDRIFNQQKGGDPCLAKRSIPTTLKKQPVEQVQAQSVNEQWPDK